MTLAEAIAEFSEKIRLSPSTQSPVKSAIDLEALHTLASHFSPDAELDQITAEGLRDFLARSYVEDAFESEAIGPEDTRSAGRLVDSLAEFFKWAGEQGAADYVRPLAVLEELRVTLPRALEITRGLIRWTAGQKGAFNFPEFLTSFEEGGRGQYDIDAAAGVGAIEGHFRVIRVEGSSVEAEHLISDERIWPIIFPEEVARLLDDRYIVTLEIVRGAGGWEITDCGTAYPPRTEL